MKKLFALFVFLSTPAFAESPREAFEGMHGCLTREAESCGEYFTQDSQALYNKVVSYDLARCVPAEAMYVSEIKTGAVRLVRVRITEGENTHVARLAYIQEKSQWKMSIPETLKRGLGDKWQSYVTATEQGYLFLQTQLKTKPGCEAVNMLVKQPKDK